MSDDKKDDNKLMIKIFIGYCIMKGIVIGIYYYRKSMFEIKSKFCKICDFIQQGDNTPFTDRIII